MKSPDRHNFDTRDFKPLALTAEQVAQLLGISVRSVWRFASAGELPRPISIGRSKRWDVRTIEDFLRRKAAGHDPHGDDPDRHDRYPCPAAQGNRNRDDRRA